MVIRLILATTLALASGTSALAETVILGDGGLTNLVVNVPTGKVMIVRASSLWDAANKVSIVSGGVTIQPDMDAGFDTRFQPRYLAGPCTFIYSSEFAMDTSVFHYDVVPNEGIQTLVATDTNTSIIQVPSGKRLRLLDGSVRLWLTVTQTNGASAQFAVSPKQDISGRSCHPEGFELAGPLTVAISGQDLNQRQCYATYFFASDVTQALGQSIQSPVGSLVTVEKSTDLQTWYPAFTTTEKSAPKAFYRLRVTK